jgi:Smg protein
MGEGVLDVLMYLFENYIDSDTDYQADQEVLAVELYEAGFRRGEIRKALAWLEGLAKLQAQSASIGTQRSTALRVFTTDETERLDGECRSFLLYLERVGVLEPAMRELVIDRVMALDEGEIDLEQLKWILLMVLFSQPGQERAVAWVEGLMGEEQPGSLLH